MILHGDSLTILKTMTEETINTCVTSPPYWGLRDYGTGTWTGGDAACDHKVTPRKDTDPEVYGPWQRSSNKDHALEGWVSGICGRCGASRIDMQLGLEQTPDEYVKKMVTIFREVRRVLKKDGTLWLNIGDSYYNYRPGKGQALQKRSFSKSDQDLPQTCARRGNLLPGLKEKDLVGIPWMLAFALRADGWYLRQDIIWNKPNPMPESVTDRCTKSHEYVFLLSKSERYYFDQDAIREKAVWKSTVPWGWDTEEGGHGTINYNHAAKHRKCQPKGSFDGKTGERAFRKTGEYRKKRSVWTVGTKPFKGAHFATYPEKLILPCVLAGSPPGGVVLDPFFGSGTTGLVAASNGREYIGIELKEKYIEIARERLGIFA